MKSTISIFWAFFLFARSAIGHKTLLGKCPEVDPMEGFDMEKFEGLWYVIELFDSGINCMTWDIVRIEENRWAINENKKSGLLYKTGVDTETDSLTVGVLTPTNYNGTFMVKWTLNPARYDLTIYFTDYKTAGVFSCQELWLGHREQAMVLSRVPNPPRREVQLAQGLLVSEYGIKIHYYNKVNHHAGCISSPENEKPGMKGPLGTAINL